MTQLSVIGQRGPGDRVRGRVEVEARSGAASSFAQTGVASTLVVVVLVLAQPLGAAGPSLGAILALAAIAPLSALVAYVHRAYLRPYLAIRRMLVPTRQERP